MLNTMLDGIGVDQSVVEQLRLSSSCDDVLQSCFKTTDFAASSYLAVGCALAEYCRSAHDYSVARIHVDNRLASLWFSASLSPIDWERGSVWDPIAGNYQGVDGWIRLHTNAPHHKSAALSVLQCEASQDRVAKAVGEWQVDKLEQAMVEAGACAASMRTLTQWQQHPQGRAVAAEPLVHWKELNVADKDTHPVSVDRPLAGIRVLDLTRVLAGPVSTRCLAAYGADVLRIDPISWNEPSVVPEVTLGKRCAHLDLKTETGRNQLIELLKSADLLIHGYRPGAMRGLGLSDEEITAVNPSIINVSLCAYGWTGPWSQRRGFDSLVQMSAGIADEGMRQFESGKPRPLPVQALDHATGYLMAAVAMHALSVRKKSGQVLSAKLSLAKSADLLMQHNQIITTPAFPPRCDADLNDNIEKSAWGLARRVHFPLTTDPVKAVWDLPACELRSYPAHW